MSGAGHVSNTGNNNFRSDLADVIEISRFAGERFDLVQAGGGNSSVKLDDGRLLVKASGMALSDVYSADDFCIVQWQPLLDFLSKAEQKFAEVNSTQAEMLAALDGTASGAVAASATASNSTKRPSIETLLHCLLGKFTLHTHPIAVVAAVCRTSWREELQSAFPGALLVAYNTPGAALALNLLKELQKIDWQVGQTIIIFLESHGLIVAGASKQIVMQTTNQVADKLAELARARAPETNCNLLRYKLVNFASALINQVCSTQWLAYLSDDMILLQALKQDSRYFLSGCATPDQFVYCGSTALSLDSLDSPSAVRQVVSFFEEYGHPPRVLLLGNEHVLLMGKSLRKCRDTEDVLRAHLLLQNCGQFSAMKFLPAPEINYLNNWEAEKYRQNL